MTEIQAEMGARSRMEHERATLLHRAGAALGLSPARRHARGDHPLMAAGRGRAARARSAELRGLLAEIAREHGVNRALMRQELAFLDHLTRLIGAEPQPGYRPPAPAAVRACRGPPVVPPHRVLNLQA